MPHPRYRLAAPWIEKLAAFWPSVGVTGLRQVGKTTLLRTQLGIEKYFSFDDEDTRDLAETSSKSFLSRLSSPCIIDEIQKVPKIFDALKSLIDRNKRPGLFYLTGSTQFSTKLGIRESLTGRIGLLQLYPMTYRELHGLKVDSAQRFLSPIHSAKVEIQVEQLGASMLKGGMPVPAFLRDETQSNLYWKSWVETLVYRDMSRVYGKNYDPEIAMDILKNMAKTYLDGEYPTAANFKLQSRRLKPYLSALETVFLIKRFRCHESGVGKDHYLLGDSGLANYLMQYYLSTEATLSLARHFIMNEILAQNEYAGKVLPCTYFKSARGSAVDLVWNGVPIKIIGSHQTSIGWQERSLEGAMKKLKSPLGILVAPTDLVQIPKSRRGIAIVPWSYWS